MSALYPFRIRVTRSTPNDAVGIQPYKGRTDATDTVVICECDASIQEKGQGKGASESLPTDGRKGEWIVFIPAYEGVPWDAIRQGDIVHDNLGRRFHVVNEYPNFMGWKLRCARLKV
ncbi:hypothetical protein [Methylosinus sp. PW1]|uniref:hypothetical protein n=1 Tax=Methylosinus sp. PW1 TaxID=107636 RepID=UPI000561F7F6|nr:hypothetical protein [Methylosinus sp. PW1]